MSVFEDNINLSAQQEQHENTEWGILLPAVAQGTATQTSKLMFNRSADGVLITVVLANEAGAWSGTPHVTTLDAHGATVTLATFTALTAAGTYIFWVSPHADKPAASKAGVTEVATMGLPRVWSFDLTYSGTPANDKMDSKASFAYTS